MKSKSRIVFFKFLLFLMGNYKFYNSCEEFLNMNTLYTMSLSIIIIKNLNCKNLMF